MLPAPTARLEPLADPRAVEAWWAESERAAAARERGTRHRATAWDTVAAMGLTAYAGLLGIGFVFALILTAFVGLGPVSPRHRFELLLLLEIDVLTAVGAWLCAELAETLGFAASVEWDPASPP